MKAISKEQEILLNKESPAFMNLKVGTIIKELQGKVGIGIAAGTNKTAVNISSFDPQIESIVAIFAVTTATGAAATKFLLAKTTDYTFTNGALKTVTDQSANTLIVVYK